MVNYLQELPPKYRKLFGEKRFIVGAKSVSSGVIKVYFWPGKELKAFDSNDDVNDNA